MHRIAKGVASLDLPTCSEGCRGADGRMLAVVHLAATRLPGVCVAASRGKRELHPDVGWAYAQRLIEAHGLGSPLSSRV
jgi:hypothetical protein